MHNVLEMERRVIYCKNKQSHYLNMVFWCFALVLLCLLCFITHMFIHVFVINKVYES